MVGTLPVLANSSSTPEIATVGPLLGHVDRNQGLVWYRPAEAGQYQLHVFPAGVTAVDVNSKDSQTQPLQVLTATASPEHDLCVTWRVTGLDPGLHYTAVVASADGQAIGGAQPCVIPTAPEHDAAVKVDLAFGSCASSTDFFDVWERIAAEGADGVVLLGDTPYIDRTELDINRSKHRQFLSIPTLQELCRTRPLWATWDDHDFGANDSDGRIRNKDLIRQAFTEYRALDYFGDGQHGVYTRFRRGPVEVFLMDPRYFSQTEPSPVDAEQPTCLGKTQWRWLLDGLKQSTATFKVLATGMIWDDKKNTEKDDWHTYQHEREALFDFIGEHRISGVLLIGGDIHVSRHLTYPLKQRIGYDLHQCIVSPLHDRTIPQLNVPHPRLVWGEPLPNVFLKLTADATVTPATLTATWLNRHGKVLYTLSTTAEELTAQA